MIKVLIVDDEEMTRSGLKEFVDWDRLGYVVVGEAEDGLEALEKIEELQPGLLICDVRMPKLDGIGLAQRLREREYDGKIIFLSGYTDIDYLQSAIRVQASDYQQKPVQIAELERLLEAMAEELKQARQQEARLAGMMEQLDRSKPEMTERLLKSILELEEASPREPAELEQAVKRVHPDFPIDGSFLCCLFAFESEQARLGWRKAAEREAMSGGLAVLLGVMNGRGVTCIAVDQNYTMEGVNLWLNRLTPKQPQNRQMGIVAGVGGTVRQLAELPVSRGQATKALSFQFYRGWNSVIWHQELPGETLNSGLFDKQAMIRFEECLHAGKLQDASDLLDHTVNELLLYPHTDVERVRMKLFRWYVTMTKIYPETMWEFENDELWSGVFVSGELFTIRNFMLRRLEIIQESMEQADAGEKSVIREVVRYIQNHYNGDVSLPALANHVYLTPTYLCILFKKEKGVSLNDYITQFRMEKAKLLLKDRKLKLYEISQMVGYQDANYFAKVFRKWTGAKPSEYRETMDL